MERFGWLADIAVVAAGGAGGAVLRFLLTLAASALPGGTSLLGTTVANLLGCLAIGALAEWGLQEAVAWSPRGLLAIRVGFLGGLTTFSTFAFEAVWLGGQGRVALMALHVGVNLGLGFCAVWAGAAWVRQTLG